MLQKPILIEHREGKSSFTGTWIEYCDKHNIPYKIVHCNDNDIIDQLKESSGLMWHWSQQAPDKILYARQLTYAAEAMGLNVFPSSKACWHFDDKIGQKYLFEALEFPFVKTWVFYDKQTAINWACETTYPKVFKLRGGAGSVNVSLIKSFKQAKKIINKMFSRGLSQISWKSIFIDRFKKLFKSPSFTNFIDLGKSFVRLFIPSKFQKLAGREKGYVYFQEFIPNCDHDTRVVVIGDKAFAFKRLVRDNDFRASGSGYIEYDKCHINPQMIPIAFDIADKTQSECIGVDFLVNGEKLQIVESSYGFVLFLYRDCQGYWDREGNWHDKPVRPAEFIIEDFLAKITK